MFWYLHEAHKAADTGSGGRQRDPMRPLPFSTRYVAIVLANVLVHEGASGMLNSASIELSKQSDALETPL